MADDLDPAAVERAAQEMDRHRWKTMGVASVECECGAVITGDPLGTAFPADRAFRTHLARAALAAARGGMLADAIVARLADDLDPASVERAVQSLRAFALMSNATGRAHVDEMVATIRTALAAAHDGVVPAERMRPGESVADVLDRWATGPTLAQMVVAEVRAALFAARDGATVDRADVPRDDEIRCAATESGAITVDEYDAWLAARDAAAPAGGGA